LHEIKHDGFRILARRDSAGVRLITRAGNDFSSRFPFIAMAVGMLPLRSCLIHGEAMFAKDHMQRTNKFAQIILRLINYFEAHDDGP
jgi:ATP-dependent DNA ligase